MAVDCVHSSQTMEIFTVFFQLLPEGFLGTVQSLDMLVSEIADKTNLCGALSVQSCHSNAICSKSLDRNQSRRSTIQDRLHRPALPGSSDRGSGAELFNLKRSPQCVCRSLAKTLTAPLSYNYSVLLVHFGNSTRFQSFTILQTNWPLLTFDGERSTWQTVSAVQTRIEERY